MAAPEVMARAIAYSRPVYRLPETRYPMSMTGTILHDLATTWRGSKLVSE